MKARVSLLLVCAMSLSLQAAEPGARSATQPPADWRARAAKYADVLAQVKWTPVADTLPNRSGGYYVKGKQYTGAPYSSVKAVGRYIGFDISVRTFLAAVENPHSVLYTENLRDKVSNAAPYYGTVCSAYTSYALGCGIWEVSRRHGPQISDGVTLVEGQSAQRATVGDVIYTPHATESSGSHVEIVTAVHKDASGKVTAVRVEESRPPVVKVTEYTPEAFDAHLAKKNKQLFRITDHNAWRGDNRAESFLFPNPQADATPATINRTVLLDLGDWVPYERERPVKFNVMDRDGLGVKKLVVQRGSEVVEEFPLTGAGVHERLFPISGDYTAYVVRPDGSKSQACEFAVCGMDMKLPRKPVQLNKSWDVGFSSENIKVIAVYLWSESDSYGRHSLFLTDEQRQRGSMTVPADLLKKAGQVQVWLIGEHPLGRLKLQKDITVVE